ncbi:peptide-methionine (S)-S-oxide reductase [Bizionia argentinensis JUB59]|uniref:Peptide methionine sulfoxide reductase MsrA n=1 Tax=Bizionia argentinensis JUB59 TaxID=1046627 RepID=G2EAF8_9FLAO|nr:peptide-methionine (S)-S-oxide reductase MsrA [Bizionia argentinensis]EGV44553.1 peptide-methionine (S)-S-oxide reductase [Bizionia argentinensis JUB59]
MHDNLHIMTVGGGCFWCVEAVFNQFKGVQKLQTGYMGGNVPGTPTYREVSSGLTGHAEVVQITFNDAIISYVELLGVFMASHDATISNADKNLGPYGSQYRSVIFYHNDTQKEIAETFIAELEGFNEKPIKTEIKPVKIFHEAEVYHQDYYNKNPEAAYCTTIISPKLKQLKKHFAKKLK